MKPGPSFFTLLSRLWSHLSASRKRQFFLLSILMVAAALAEVLSLGALLPFIGVLTAPEMVFKYSLAQKLSNLGGFSSPEQLILPLTVGFIIASILSGGIRLLLLRVSTRLAYACGADLSNEVYRKTLYQPYQVHVARNSSIIISGITVKVALAVNVLYQLLTFISSAVLLFSISMALVLIDPVVALIASAGFGACYVLISIFSQKKLHEHSKRIAFEQTQAVKALQEGLGGIRDVLLDSTQPFFCEVYRKADAPLRRSKGDIIYLSGRPRYIMEGIGMVLIAILAYVLSQQSGGIKAALPVLGALALGAQRMLPALQQGYAAWSSIVGDQASLSDTIDLLDQPVPLDLLLPSPSPLLFTESIEFKNVYFRYSDQSPCILNNLNFKIPKGSRVGFVGATGSGKSTALDLLMGLLRPTGGSLLVDSVEVTGNSIRAWQSTLSNVPQAIYLSDATMAENIAFGVPFEKIDLERVKKAAEQAQIASFIEKNPQSYKALVGERGIRISGGQRQRIGIARALYKKASVLIFDEATSALDNATEKSVMEAIDGLDKNLTILIIAHRLTTVRRCDFIIELDQGRVVSQGTYDQLVESSPTFRRMTQGLE